jgi:hypothetical protein
MNKNNLEVRKGEFNWRILKREKINEKTQLIDEGQEVIIHWQCLFFV